MSKSRLKEVLYSHGNKVVKLIKISLDNYDDITGKVIETSQSKPQTVLSSLTLSRRQRSVFLKKTNS